MTGNPPRRHLLARLPAEGDAGYIQRHGATAGELERVLSTVSQLVFGGCSADTAVIHAMWVHGLYDEEEDMKVPGRKRERIECDLTRFDKRVDGKAVPSVMVTCSKCGHQTESYGTHERSVRRCMALMAQECPNYESNYYTLEKDDDDGENYL